jgi:chromate reductase
MRAAVAAADALLVATPEYNSSIPGQLKNAVDWLSRPFPDSALRNRPVAVVGASTGQFGAAWAQAELRKVLGAAGARVLQGGVGLPRAGDAFDPDGRLRSERVREQLREIVEELALQLVPA